MQATFEFYAGMVPAICQKDRMAAEIEAGFLEALLKSRSGTDSIDAGYRDLRTVHNDGGKWVGGVVRRLKDDGVIQQIGTTKSERRSRHGGYVGLWRLTDAEAAENRIRFLRSVGHDLEDLTDA